MTTRRHPIVKTMNNQGLEHFIRWPGFKILFRRKKVGQALKMQSDPGT
jgi:hypothetical protein